MLKQVEFLNEKGNPVAKVRNAMKANVEDKLQAVLGEVFEGTVKNADTGFSVPVAVDEKTGITIYARVDFTISTKDPAEKKESKPKEKKDVEVVEVNLFD